MKKEKVFIILSHKNMIAKGAHPGRAKGENVNWEVAEQVEFVNQVRNRHIQSGSIIADYINRTMVTGSRFGMGEYSVFEEYIRKKYSKQMAELDAAYGVEQVKDESPEVFVDSLGNVRERTVFDV